MLKVIKTGRTFYPNPIKIVYSKFIEYIDFANENENAELIKSLFNCLERSTKFYHTWFKWTPKKIEIDYFTNNKLSILLNIPTPGMVRINDYETPKKFKKGKKQVAESSKVSARKAPPPPPPKARLIKSP